MGRAVVGRAVVGSVVVGGGREERVGKRERLAGHGIDDQQLLFHTKSAHGSIVRHGSLAETEAGPGLGGGGWWSQDFVGIEGFCWIIGGSVGGKPLFSGHSR
ncbi:hypothetical protein GCM10023346_13070 [Arthrobacter gyeryongensis]|uniref:Uncharacterized protein n=1 Tax=Arthrobacter gyeryongensis TaxID=1650592 RepID=A0ABP9S7Y6_9MICC